MNKYKKYSNRPINQLNYRPEIDGLRALAVLSVFIFHLNSSWLPGGFLGVDIFFVISGFLITSIITTQITNGHFSFKEFYKRRIKRIYPIFIVTLFLASLFSTFFFMDDESELLRKTIELATVFFSNFYLAHRQGYWDLSSSENPILHIWSLAVEEQYYLFFPIVLYFVYKKFKNKSSLLNISLILFIFFICSTFIPEQSYQKVRLFNTYYVSNLRFPELLLGSLLALISIKYKEKLTDKYNSILSMISVMGLMLCLIIFNNEIPLFPGIAALIPCLCTVLLIYSMRSNNYVKSFFSLKINVFIGKISYSLYLFHWLFIALAHYITGQKEFSNQVILIILVLTFSCSILSYYLLEQPIRKSKLSFKQSVIFLYLIPSLVVIGFNLSTKSMIKNRTNEVANIQFDHVINDTDIPAKIAVIGDSHAGHLNNFLHYVGYKEGWKADVVRFPLLCHFPNKRKIHDSCVNTFKLVEDYPVVMVSMFYSLYRNIKPISRSSTAEFFVVDFEKRFKYFIEKLSKTHQVYVLGDIKMVNRSPLRSVLLNRFHLGKYLDPITVLGNTDKTNQEIYNMVKDIPNVKWVDPSKYLPTDTFFIDGKPLYKDQDHLNNFGSYYMGVEFNKNERLLSVDEVNGLYSH